MKIIVFGGAGDMGSRAVEDLALEPDVERVTIADRDAATAHALAASLRNAPATVDVKVVDANDPRALVAAMTGYDVAASALGPFYRFEKPLVRAAIEAGVDYCSICDDWTAAEEVFDELDGPAREAGRVVVTGIGASPGLTNVAVRHLARDMDTVDKVDISVYQPLDAGGGPAVLEHMLYIMSGEPTAYRDGAWVDIKACSEQRVVEFPQFGSLRVWNMGHAEPITVPRFFPQVREVNFWMGYGRGSRALVKPSQWGLFNGERRRAFWLRTLKAIEERTRPESAGVGALRIDVHGTRDGRPVHAMACGVGTMRDATALPLSAGALTLGRQQLLCEGGGVFAPEGAINPVPFMTQLEKKGIASFEDIAMTRSLMPE